MFPAFARIWFRHNVKIKHKKSPVKQQGFKNVMIAVKNKKSGPVV